MSVMAPRSSGVAFRIIRNPKSLVLAFAALNIGLQYAGRRITTILYLGQMPHRSIQKGWIRFGQDVTSASRFLVRIGTAADPGLDNAQLLGQCNHIGARACNQRAPFCVEPEKSRRR